MQEVNLFTSRVVNLETGNAEIARLFDRAHRIATRRELSRLVAATLAAPGRTGAGAFGGEELRVGSDFVDAHRERMNGAERIYSRRGKEEH
jgi:hypothetical protein